MPWERHMLQVVPVTHKIKRSTKLQLNLGKISERLGRSLSATQTLHADYCSPSLINHVASNIDQEGERERALCLQQQWQLRVDKNNEY